MCGSSAHSAHCFCDLSSPRAAHCYCNLSSARRARCFCSLSSSRATHCSCDTQCSDLSYFNRMAFKIRCSCVKDFNRLVGLGRDQQFVLFAAVSSDQMEVVGNLQWQNSCRTALKGTRVGSEESFCLILYLLRLVGKILRQSICSWSQCF